MSSYRISITREAVRALGKPGKPVRRRVQTAIDRLAAEPRPPGARPLRGQPELLRLRVGDYRVVYTVRDQELVVLVVDLGHRREIYRDR